jgi:hypothetical protein
MARRNQIAYRAFGHIPEEGVAALPTSPHVPRKLRAKATPLQKLPLLGCFDC